MSDPGGLRGRFVRLLQHLVQTHDLPPGAVEGIFAAYPESVRAFLVTAYEHDADHAFREAFQLVDLLEDLGCQAIEVEEPGRWDPVEVRVRRGDGRPGLVQLARRDLQSERLPLARRVRRQLGIERATVEIGMLSARVRELLGQDRPPFDVGAPLRPAGEEPEPERKRITRKILKPPPPSQVAVSRRAQEKSAPGELGTTLRRALDQPRAAPPAGDGPAPGPADDDAGSAPPA